MDSERITELLQPYASLNNEQLRQTSMYIDILLKWNARMNLTAVRHPDEIVTRHFGESYFAAAHLLPTADRREVIDVGSGAGFPGVALAIFSPDAHVTLIESNRKKAAFLREAINHLQLRNADVLAGRAEEFQGKGDLVIMRAVEKFERSLPVAVNLVNDRGRIALMVGRGQESLASRLTPRVRWSEALPIPGSDSRVLMLGSKE